MDLGLNVYRRWPNRTIKATRISGRGVSVVLTENARIKRFSDYYDFVGFFPRVPDWFSHQQQLDQPSPGLAITRDIG